MATENKYKLLIHSASQIVCVAEGKPLIKGNEMKNIKVIESDSTDGCCIIVDREGKIFEVGYNSTLKDKYANSCETVYDASGQSIIPGLVDGHTHPVWAGDRVHEFAMKLAGASYMDIHQRGGGINFTVEHTRAASEDELYSTFKERLRKLLLSGVTLVECKTGYGLDYETELKMLKVINRGIHDDEVKNDISVTFCGAHSVPMGMTADDAADDIVQNQIPKLQQLCEQKDIHIDNIDVFCERGVFDVKQTRKILERGKAAGWNLNFHAEELNCLNSVEMGAELNAKAMSHLEEISDAGIKAMADKGCIATILPTTAYLLHLKHPPVRKMIDCGVAVALGTDFNPNAFCLSMPLVMNIACVMIGMTLSEAICAATLNAAASLSKSQTHGSIEKGKIADLVILNSSSWEHIVYQMGTNDAIEHVVKNGEFVYSKSQ